MGGSTSRVSGGVAWGAAGVASASGVVGGIERGSAWREAPASEFVGDQSGPSGSKVAVGE